MNKPIKKFMTKQFVPHHPGKQPLGHMVPSPGQNPIEQPQYNPAAIPSATQTNIANQQQASGTPAHSTMTQIALNVPSGAMDPSIGRITQQAHQLQQSPVFDAVLKRLPGIPINIKGLPQTNLPQMQEASSHTSEEIVDEIKEQLQNYLEVCDVLSSKNIDYEMLAELLFVMMKSLNFDFFVLFTLSDADKTFNQACARGLKSQLEADMLSSFEKTISSGSILWPELIKIAMAKDGYFFKWIVKEKIESPGFVPFSSEGKIIGFMMIGAYSKKTRPPISSYLLDLCGGRIGMAFSIAGSKNNNGFFEKNVSSFVSEIAENNKKNTEYLDFLNSSSAGKDELLNKILVKCKDIVNKNSEAIKNLTEEIRKYS